MTLLPNTCPHCHTPLTGEVMELDSSEKPIPGDLHICAECNCVSVYIDNMTLRPATHAEEVECFNTLAAHQSRLDAAVETAYRVSRRLGGRN